MLNLVNHKAESSLVNSFWLIGEKVISLAFVLLSNILIAREIGTEAFGILSYLLAIFAILTPLSSIGFNALITRELLQGTEPKNTIVITGLFFRLIGAVVAVISVVLLLSFINLDVIQEHYWAVVLLAIVNISNAFHIVDFWYQAKQLNRVIVLCRLITTIIFFLIKIIAVYVAAPLDWFIWIYAAEYLFLSLCFVLLLIKNHVPVSLGLVNWSYGVRLFKQASWLILSGIASVIYLKVDQVMLGEMVSASELGLYAVASRLSEVWYFLATAIVTAYFPKILKIKADNSNQYSAQLQLICDVLFILAVFIAVVVTFVGQDLIVLLYGKQYSAAGIILIIHIWAGIFVFMRALLSKWLIAEHLVKFSFVTHGVGAVVNIVLNLWLIPHYAGVGAAIATVASYAVASYVALIFSRSTWPMVVIMTKSLFSPMRVLFNSLKFVAR